MRRGMPACRNSFSMSDDQNSNTSKRVPAAYGGQPGRPVNGSIATARCSWLTRIGDLPGMYHVSTVCGQSTLGRSPLSAQTATRLTPGGGRQRRRPFVWPGHVERVGDAEEQRRRGVDADERGIAAPVRSCQSTRPARTDRRRPRTRRREIPRTCRSSTRRATARAAATVPSASGRGLWRSMSSVTKVASGTEQPHARRCDVVRAGSLGPQRPQHALVGEHRVQAGELLHRHLAAAERQRQSVERLRLHVAHARALEELIEARLLQLRRDPDRRHVAAANQRFLGGDRPEETAVEVLRA